MKKQQKKKKKKKKKKNYTAWKKTEKKITQHERGELSPRIESRPFLSALTQARIVI